MPPKDDDLFPELDKRDAISRRRHRIVVDRRQPGRITVAGREYVDVSSNDYLGLASDPRVIASAREAAEQFGWGAGASALVTGYHQAHQDLEQALAEFAGTEAALLFASGFAANHGAIPALTGPEDLIFSDVRNHASLIDGCRLARCERVIYDGRQLDELERLLRDKAHHRRRWIVTDAVFSMDGDIAPLAEICSLADRYGAYVYVDEAHAVGILGPNGRGVCEAAGVEERVAVRLGTLSKALGGVGGFILGSHRLIDGLVNFQRDYIYSTALPPASAVASRSALRIVQTEPERRLLVLKRAEQFRRGLASVGIAPTESQTPIVPIFTAEDRTAIRLADRLREAGFWATAIRPPTVPVGTCRVRISLSASHKVNEINDLLGVLAGSLADR